MWNYELGEYGFAAVSEWFIKKTNPNPICKDGYVKKEDYFNSDVLIFKIDFFRQHFDELLEVCKFVGKHRDRYVNAENDVLAVFCYKDYTRLPENFNVLINHLHLHQPQPSYTLEKALYHYSDFVKPSFDTDDVFNRLYLQYFLKTPWATPDMFGNIDKKFKEIFRQTINTYKNYLLHFTNLFTHRQRAFFLDNNSIKAIKNIFAIKDDELIIDASQPNADGIFIEEMFKSKGKKIFILFVNNYYPIRNFLLRKNFVEGTDFINAVMFLSERYGFKDNFDTKAILQAM